MRELIEKLVLHGLRHKEDFYGGSKVKLSSYHFIAFIISLIISQLLLLFVGKWLWNTYLTPIVNVKQIESIWTLLGISVLLKLLIN